MAQLEKEFFVGVRNFYRKYEAEGEQKRNKQRSNDQFISRKKENEISLKRKESKTN
jgi:hypothetical protein